MVRYHDGASFEQPWMGVSVKCLPEYRNAVEADLMKREAMIVSGETDKTQVLLQARAPLANLLGYRAALDVLTDNSARHSMWLSHYAPMETPPPGGKAA
jgi:translation elongation factor EF-G